MHTIDNLISESPDYELNNDTFEKIFFAAPMAMSITNSEGEILHVNHSFAEITGYQEQELIRQKSSILSYKMTPESVYQQLWSTITRGEVWEGKLINKRKNGSLYVADTSIAPLTSKNGSRLYYSIQRDITETYQLQVHEKNQSALFHTVLNAAPIAMALVDEKAQTLLDNIKCQQLEKQLSGSIVDLLIKHLRQESQCSSIEEYLGNKSHCSISIQLEETEHHSERWFDCSMIKIPVTDTKAEAYFQPSDEFYTLIGVFDRTKEIQFLEERRLNAITLMANDTKFVHSMQEVMLATMHQLQGPFNMIDSAVTILKQSNHSCPGLHAMDEAMIDANQALNQIKEAIPERVHEPMQPTNLNQIIRDTISITTKELLNSSIKIDIQLTPDLKSINGKPHRLLLAMKQLLDNSIDAIQSSQHSERSILITTSENSNETTVSIEDSGLGISDENRLKVFQPFFSTKPKIHNGCRGIGLTIVHQVLNEHRAILEIGISPHLGGASIQLIFPKEPY